MQKDADRQIPVWMSEQTGRKTGDGSCSMHFLDVHRVWGWTGNATPDKSNSNWSLKPLCLIKSHYSTYVNLVYKLITDGTVFTYYCLCMCTAAAVTLHAGKHTHICRLLTHLSQCEMCKACSLECSSLWQLSQCDTEDCGLEQQDRLVQVSGTSWRNQMRSGLVLFKILPLISGHVSRIITDRV